MTLRLHTFERLRKTCETTDRIQQRITLEPDQTREPGIGGSAEPAQRLVAFTELRIRGAQIVRNMMVALVVRQHAANRRAGGSGIALRRENGGKRHA